MTGCTCYDFSDTDCLGSKMTLIGQQEDQIFQCQAFGGDGWTLAWATCLK